MFRSLILMSTLSITFAAPAITNEYFVDDEGNLIAVDYFDFDCPEPNEPNCGAPNGAGGWEPDPITESYDEGDLEEGGQAANPDPTPVPIEVATAARPVPVERVTFTG